MTVQYWSRKLMGCAVKVKENDQWQPVQDIALQRDERADSPYPEDYLDNVVFYVGRKKLHMDEFQCAFPEEGYRMVHGTPYLGRRSMTRAYRLSPHVDNWEVTGSGLDVRLCDWLNTKQTYSKPDALFKWGKHAIITNEIAILQLATDVRTVMYMGTEVLRLRRGKEGQRLSKVFAIPQIMIDWWGDKFNTLIPPTWKTALKTPLDEAPIIATTPIGYRKVPEGTISENGDFYVNDEDNMLVILVDNDIWYFPDEEEVLSCFDDGPLTRDILIIMRQEGVINEE